MASSQQSNSSRSSTAAINPFLRAWVWKREHKPDKDRFDLPYIHRLLVNCQPRTLTIEQARFSTKGFSSTVWDSAIVLSKYIERLPQLVDGKHCIELGAGCGLPGIIAACCGASSVLLTDFSENLPILERNIITNGVSGTAAVAALDWGNPNDAVKRAFDIIFATDVMYDSSVIDSFLTTLRRISNAESRILLAYGRNRQAEDHFLRESKKWFSMEKIKEEELDEVYRCIDVDVFEVWVRPDAKGGNNFGDMEL